MQDLHLVKLPLPLFLSQLNQQSLSQMGVRDGPGPEALPDNEVGCYTRESCLLLPGLAHNIPMASGAADQELQTGLWPETCTTSNPLGKKRIGMCCWTYTALK